MGMNHTMAVMTSSVDMKWATPQEWFDYLDLEFDFTLDPCCEHETAKCERHFTPAEDGLAHAWTDERVFMNPPYGRELGVWMAKAYRECRDNGALVVAFVPARVDTEWWHQYAAKATEVRFPKGRVKFAGADNSAPFPVAVVVFRPRVSSPKRKHEGFKMSERSERMENTSPCTCSELPGYPRAETIRCPECGNVQEAQVHFEDWMPFPAYVHECEACGYTIMESEWERVANASDHRRAEKENANEE